MGRWRPPAAGSVSYLPDDRKHVFPYGFDLPELSNPRREPIEAERGRHADNLRGSIGHNKQGRRARRKAIYATFKMSIYHAAQVT
jgi:hypothetical protein